MIYHSETNCDGYKPEGITFPSIDAQYKLIRKTYEECKLDPERYITYVEGHITGTPVSFVHFLIIFLFRRITNAFPLQQVGDPIESQALGMQCILCTFDTNQKSSLKN